MRTRHAILLLFLLPLAAAAQVYKWVDEQGQTHYSQQPPVEQKSQQINPSTGGGLGNDEAAKQRDQYREMFASPDEKKAKEAEEQAKKKAEYEKELKARCDRVRASLTAMQNNPGRRLKNDKGEVIRLTEEQRQKDMKTAQEWLEKNCK